MPLYIVVLCLLFATSLAVGQILFKLAANSIRNEDGSLFLAAATNPMAWLAFGWYAASSFLWLFILMRIPLARAYPFALLGSALVPLMSWLVLRERLTVSYFIGTLIILAGMYIIFSQGHDTAEPHQSESR